MRIQQLEERYMDPVTGGGNEYWLEHVYEENCRYRLNHYAVVTINIKKFKKFHIRYGKQASDEILKEIYEIFDSFLHEDEWMGRLYSDHFVLLLHRKNKEELVQFVYDSDWAGYLCKDARVLKNIFFTYGFYMINEPGDDFYTALNKAEMARTMCREVRIRSTCYEFYDSSFVERFQRVCDMEERVVAALEHEEFVAYLQPKVRLSDEKIVGAEVLLRWFDETGRLIPLPDYLPVIDQNGYIRNVDLFTFEKMCEKLEQCLKEGVPVVPLSFNISKSYFDDDELLSDYMQVFEKYEVPESLIQFELMESISFDDSARLLRIVPGFKRRGFVCMLDDFGSGYSSFQVLSRLNLDALKIDRQFFMKEFNTKDCSIIETIIKLAKTLHMETIAEGVEQKEYIQFLKNTGCDMVQGFYYYKPMPVEEFLSLLASQNAL